MDGASKFVKGDAIAGVVIVLVNLLGGFAVGVLQHGLAIGEAITRYSLLSVGDGLVTQIPALLISVASGLIVTRAATDEDGGLGADLWGQLLHSKRVLGDRVGRGAGFIAMLPGLPKLPFLAARRRRSAIGGIAAERRAVSRSRTSSPLQPIDPAQPTTPRRSLAQMRVEPLELELAPDLIDLIDPSRGRQPARPGARRCAARSPCELGLVLPLVRTRDNLLAAAVDVRRSASTASRPAGARRPPVACSSWPTATPRCLPWPADHRARLRPARRRGCPRSSPSGSRRRAPPSSTVAR